MEKLDRGELNSWRILLSAAFLQQRLFILTWLFRLIGHFNQDWILIIWIYGIWQFAEISDKKNSTVLILLSVPFLKVGMHWAQSLSLWRHICHWALGDVANDGFSLDVSNIVSSDSSQDSQCLWRSGSDFGTRATLRTLSVTAEVIDLKISWSSCV